MKPGGARAGDMVTLVVPGNLRLHGSAACVRRTTGWGAILHAPAAGSGVFRALWEEMEQAGPELVASSPTGQLDDAPGPAPKRVPYTPPGNEGCVETADGPPGGLPHAPPGRAGDGPTGDFCDSCGSPNMKRDGRCLTCLNCGTTSGGCS